MQNSDIVRMANQITTYFSIYPKAEAIDGISKHIHAFWDPRMRNALKALLDSGGEGLDPLFIEAMGTYFQGPKTPQRVAAKAPKVAPKGAEPSIAEGGSDGG